MLDRSVLVPRQLGGVLKLWCWWGAVLYFLAEQGPKAAKDFCCSSV